MRSDKQIISNGSSTSKQHCSKKRVLLVAPQPFFANRGTPMNVRAMASSLGGLGYQVDLLVFPFGDDIALPGVIIHRSLPIPGITRVPPGPSWGKFVLDIFLSLKALRMVFFRSYDLIHGVEEGGFIAAVLSFLRRTPYVFDMDSCMPEQLEYSGFFRSKRLLSVIGKLERWCLRNSAAVLTVCEDLSNTAKAIAPEVSVHQIEDFPLDAATEVDSRLVSALIKEFALSGRAVVLYTGNFESYQGMDLLLESFAELLSRRLMEVRTEGSQAEPLLLLVGGGEESNPLVAKYKSYVTELGLERHVVFAGQRPSEEMGAFMALADVLASPRTLGGNTPLKVYTYMASGKPVIATKINSHTQVLSDDTAFLAEPDVEHFASALLASLDDSPEGMSRRMQIALRAKRLVDTRYSKEEFERRLGEMYVGLIGPGGVEVADIQKQKAASRG